MASKLTEDKDEKKTIEQYMEEDVEYTAPFSANPQEREIIVSVNGDFLRIKRGETVTIKRKHLEAIRNADRQRAAAYKYQYDSQRAGDAALAKM